MRFANFIPAFVFLLIAIVLAIVTSLADKPNFNPNMIGKQIPQFETTLLNSSEKISDKDLTQKPSIVNFFASWCVACKAEHDELLKLQKEGYKIYGVNSGDVSAEAAKYLKEHGNPFYKVVFDPRRKLAVAFGTTGMPETFVISTNGEISYHYRGALNAPLIEDLKKAYATTK